MKELLDKAIELREAGSLEEANNILLQLVNDYPENADVNYQCAWSFDVMGKEKEAVPFYEKALSIGLSEKDMKEAYLGLGSTYRTIGEYEKSKELFEDAISKYDDKSLKVFLAMTLYNLGEHQRAMEILLKIIAESSDDPSIMTFKKAIEFYSDKLDQLF